MKRVFGLYFLFISSSLSIAAQEMGSITGLIRDTVTQAPISEARIMVDGKKKATTDRDGRFLLELPPAFYKLSVKAQGYEEESKMVNLLSDKTIEADFELIASLTFYGEEFVIEPPEPTPAEEVTVSKTNIEETEIRDTSVSLFNDLSETMKTLPGVITSGDFSSALYVRGGYPSETIYILDRVFIDWPYRWGGMLTMFNARLIDEIDFYSGGFPAEAGQSLAGVIDIRYKKGSTKKMSGLLELSPTTAELLLSGPLKKESSSYLFSAKRTHYDYIAKLLIKDDKGNVFPYFDDGLMKLYFDLSKQHKLTISSLYAGEGMDMWIEEKDEPDAAGGHFGYSYKMRVSALDHKWLLTERHSLQTTLAYKKDNGDFYFYHPESSFKQEINQKGVSLRSDLDWQMSPLHKIRCGTYIASYDLKFSGQFEGDVIEGTDTLTKERKKEAYEFKNDANYIGLYAWDRWRIKPKLTGDFGLRYEQFDLTKDSSLTPRLSLKYDLSDKTSLKAAYCYNSQFPMNIYDLDEKYGNPRLNAQKGIDYILGIERKVSDDVRLKVEAYYKDLKDLILEDKKENFLNKGKGEAYGLELFLQKKEAKRIDGWISYAMSVSRRQRGDFEYILENGTTSQGVFNDPKLYPTEQDRTHTLSIVGNYKLNPKWRLSAKWRFNTGNPYTPLAGVVASGTTLYNPIWGEYNSGRMPNYQTLDVKIERLFKIKKMDCSTYLQFLNLYNHKNIYSYYYSKDYKEREEFTMLPFIFLGGFEMRF
ncbi:TonB-dependent receptor [bacterium]|nr:TonB-dependent receptor [bacterium]MBU1600071.1 TonB-dependent receptor [bacterium]